MPVVLELGKLTQKDFCEFQASLAFIVSSELARIIKKDFSQTTQKGWRDGSSVKSLSFKDLSSVTSSTWWLTAIVTFLVSSGVRHRGGAQTCMQTEHPDTQSKN